MKPFEKDYQRRRAEHLMGSIVRLHPSAVVDRLFSPQDVKFFNLLYAHIYFIVELNHY